jgi:hypothetical protein
MRRPVAADHHPPPPDTWDILVAESDGSGPPEYHVRDEVRVLAALAPCVVPPVADGVLSPVAFGPRSGTLWLPDAAAAEPDEVPDATWQGWTWPTGDSVALFASRDPWLPGLHTITRLDASLRRVTVAGRPMRLRRFGPGDPAYAGEGYAAEVHGYLDDATSFWAMINAGTPERRDLLLAALCTLRLDGDVAGEVPAPGA